MSEQQDIKLSRLSFGTIFKIIFWANLCMWGLILLLALLFAIVLPSAITVNGVPATTTSEALRVIPIFAVMGLIFSALGGVGGGGLLKFFAKFLPLGALRLSS